VLIEYHRSIAPPSPLTFQFCQTSPKHRAKCGIKVLVPLLQKWSIESTFADMALLIPSGLRKCWIWKGFVAVDSEHAGYLYSRILRGIAHFAGVAFLLTQVPKDRLYAGAGQIENPQCPQKAIAASYEPAPEIEPSRVSDHNLARSRSGRYCSSRSITPRLSPCP
jgi:hypothetical protein